MLNNRALHASQYNWYHTFRGILHAGLMVMEMEMVGGRWEHQDEFESGDLHRLGALHGRMTSRHQG